MFLPACPTVMQNEHKVEGKTDISPSTDMDVAAYDSGAMSPVRVEVRRKTDDALLGAASHVPIGALMQNSAYLAGIVGSGFSDSIDIADARTVVLHLPDDAALCATVDTNPFLVERLVAWTLGVLQHTDRGLFFGLHRPSDYGLTDGYMSDTVSVSGSRTMRDPEPLRGPAGSRPWRVITFDHFVLVWDVFVLFGAESCLARHMRTFGDMFTGFWRGGDVASMRRVLGCTTGRVVMPDPTIVIELYAMNLLNGTTFDRIHGSSQVDFAPKRDDLAGLSENEGKDDMSHPCPALFSSSAVWHRLCACRGRGRRLSFGSRRGCCQHHTQRLQVYAAYGRALIEAPDRIRNKTETPRLTLARAQPGLLAAATAAALRDWYEPLIPLGAFVDRPFSLGLCDVLGDRDGRRFCVRTGSDMDTPIEPILDPSHSTASCFAENEAHFVASLASLFPVTWPIVASCLDDGNGRVVLAGGSVVNAMQAPLLQHHTQGSDLDVWVIGRNDGERRMTFEAAVRHLFERLPHGWRALVEGSVVTFVPPSVDAEARTESVQIIYTDCANAGQIVSHFDLSHACALYDRASHSVKALWACVWSVVSRTTTPIAGVLVKPERLAKARAKGFEPAQCRVSADLAAHADQPCPQPLWMWCYRNDVAVPTSHRDWHEHAPLPPHNGPTDAAAVVPQAADTGMTRPRRHKRRRRISEYDCADQVIRAFTYRPLVSNRMQRMMPFSSDRLYQTDRTSAPKRKAIAATPTDEKESTGDTADRDRNEPDSGNIPPGGALFLRLPRPPWIDLPPMRMPWGVSCPVCTDRCRGPVRCTKHRDDKHDCGHSCCLRLILGDTLVAQPSVGDTIFPEETYHALDEHLARVEQNVRETVEPRLAPYRERGQEIQWMPLVCAPPGTDREDVALGQTKVPILDVACHPQTPMHDMTTPGRHVDAGDMSDDVYVQARVVLDGVEVRRTDNALVLTPRLTAVALCFYPACLPDMIAALATIVPP